jgi:hypothetical protein
MTFAVYPPRLELVLDPEGVAKALEALADDIREHRILPLAVETTTNALLDGPPDVPKMSETFSVRYAKGSNVP